MKHSFAGCGILEWQWLSFSILEDIISLSSDVYCCFKDIVILMVVSLYLTCLFFLDSFKVFTLFFGTLQFHFKVHWTFWIWNSYLSWILVNCLSPVVSVSSCGTPIGIYVSLSSNFALLKLSTNIFKHIK